MYIDSQSWSDCDVCGKDVKAEYAAVHPGATGRVCVVLSVCRNCLGDNEVTPIEKAREYWDNKPGNWAEF